VTTWTAVSPVQDLGDYVRLDYVREGYVDEWGDSSEAPTTWTAVTPAATVWAAA
jgi:hypothetical protein